jgi:hypothetical protein
VDAQSELPDPEYIRLVSCTFAFFVVKNYPVYEFCFDKKKVLWLRRRSAVDGEAKGAKKACWGDYCLKSACKNAKASQPIYGKAPTLFHS